MTTRRKLRKLGVKRPGLIVRKAKRFNLPVAFLVAVLEAETGIPQRNIFGCDYGAGKAFCHERVTNAKINALLKSPLANGVGWTQLTWKPYVVEAHKRPFGAARVANQVHVGARILRDHVKAYGYWGALKAYNGSAEYANRVYPRFRVWQEKLR